MSTGTSRDADEGRRDEPGRYTRQHDHAGQHDHDADQDRVSVLDPGASERLRGRWQEVQAGFVDEPRQSVTEADQLVGEVLDEVRENPDAGDAGAAPAGQGGAVTSDGPALAAALPALLAALGTPLPDPDIPPPLTLPPARSAVLLLIDGLGRHLLTEHAADAPFLAAMADAGPLTVGFPTSTPISVTSLGTGLPPGAHGTLGVRFRVEDTLLDALTWTEGTTDLRERLAPEQVQSRPTLFEQAAAAGVPSTVVSDRAYRESGLTRSALRGATYRGVGALGDLAAETLTALAHPGLVYAYHADLDQLGHLRGPGSLAWRWQLRQIDHLVALLAEELPPGTVLAVTGDHGMVTVDRRHDADTHPDLRHGEPMVGGDPRARLVYARPGSAPDVLAAWRTTLGDDADVCPGEEAVEAGWFGPVDDAVRARIPDVVAATRGNAAIVRSEGEPILARLPGQHGSLSDAERLVPLLVHAADAG